MINKILCFFGRHVWECVANLVMKWPNGIKGYTTLLKCKHCGARHE